MHSKLRNTTGFLPVIISDPKGSTIPLSLHLNLNVVLFLSSSDLLKGVLEQSLPGYRYLYMAGQSIGLDRDKNVKVQFLIQKTSLSLKYKKVSKILLIVVVTVNPKSLNSHLKTAPDFTFNPSCLQNSINTF